MIQPGLERIAQLLKNVHFSWTSIHVAGTNGKGSICHYASTLLTRRLIKCGKFTSPHLVNRWDCISINERPVNERLFRKIETHYAQLSQREGINASPFEILTATAFHIFNEEKVEVGVVEVGMGGRLDATNILNNQAVSVISKIARDHQGFLGTTLEEIAHHKAGILKPNVPYIVNPQNEWNVQNTIDQFAKEIGAGPRLTGDTRELRETLFSSPNWHRFAQTLQPFQRDNAVLAIVAIKETASRLGLELSNSKLAEALVSIRRKAIPGRLQYHRVQPVFGNPHRSGREIVVDGAHNPDAAKALNEFVLKNERQRNISGLSRPRSGWPVTWVLAMTEGKDARQYLEILLQPGDSVITTSFGPVDGMPWVKPMDPTQLLHIAKAVQPGITGLPMNSQGALRALCAAKYLTETDHPIVLTGSLYLIGDFHRELRPRGNKTWWTDPEREDDRAFFKSMHEEQRRRVNQVLSLQEPDALQGEADIGESEQAKRQRLARESRGKLQYEIEDLNRQLKTLEAEEHRISRSRSFESKKSRSILDYTQALNNQNADLEDIRRQLEVLPVAGREVPSGYSLQRQMNKALDSMSSLAEPEDERKDSSRRDGALEDADGSKPRIRIHKHLAGDNKGVDRRRSL
ncbi:Mur ligase [Cucurbitaria berberidis CBS 394.84]|uniref:Mur ligase n=1 Tax=Cucurbitaria berberidis CBS 394.84 TaxID=1168544 RepID=A0A9P4GRK8_9PLEO|nr:Mur ligase [Cucurbitaria berberidis CBS 394.84]KAF1849999.1 Mur ligase [Cucurbitaria berberidis CBS 394.84]